MMQAWLSIWQGRAGFPCATLQGSMLVQGDFSQNLKMLQRYPPVDVNAILYKAQQLSLS